MRDRILAVLRDKQIAFPDLEMLADEIEAAVRGDVENTLSAHWSKENGQLIFHWPPGGQPDVHLVSFVLVGIGIGAGGLAYELQDRGYDIETLKFEIKK